MSDADVDNETSANFDAPDLDEHPEDRKRRLEFFEKNVITRAEASGKKLSQAEVTRLVAIWEARYQRKKKGKQMLPPVEMC